LDDVRRLLSHGRVLIGQKPDHLVEFVGHEF
jgi:hypothetical protein